jgi:hypothetical protein
VHLIEHAVKSPCRTVIVSTGCIALFISDKLLAVEEAEYQLVLSEGDMEVREYAPSIVAETVVEGDFEDAGNKALRLVFQYIDGNNRAGDKIAMTAPVTQGRRGEKIAMTAPVSQRVAKTGWAVSFMMPADYTMDTIPAPLDPRVVIREILAYRAAVVRYPGCWSERNYSENLERLRQWAAEQHLTVTGDPVWARYDAPFIPWFLRRNEILLPLLE